VIFFDPDFYADFIHQASSKPIQTTSVILAWVIVAVGGYCVCRLRPRSRLFEWLIWTYVCSAIVQSLFITRAFIYEGVVFAYYNDYGIFWHPLIFLFSLLTDLLWPLGWLPMLLLAALDGYDSPLTTLLFLGVIATFIGIGALAAAMITFSRRGLPAGLQWNRTQTERD